MKYSNWKNSFDKWTKIIEKIKNKEIESEDILGNCGYCVENNKNAQGCCDECPLNKNNICSNILNYDITFWKLKRNLTKGKPPWKTTLRQANKILNAIVKEKVCTN